MECLSLSACFHGTAQSSICNTFNYAMLLVELCVAAAVVLDYLHKLFLKPVGLYKAFQALTYTAQSNRISKSATGHSLLRKEIPCVVCHCYVIAGNTHLENLGRICWAGSVSAVPLVSPRTLHSPSKSDFSLGTRAR